MEGRDIGTAVFPDAEVKIFLDAAPEVRGNRRFRQTIPAAPPSIAEQNSDRQAPEPESAEQQRATEEAILRDLKERDYRDRHRAESPLQPAADAVILDSTAMTLDEVLARAEEIVHAHLPASK
jgi:cytidylate kinase